MRALTALGLTLLAMSIPWIASADVGGTRSGFAVGDPGVNRPALSTPVDAWNDALQPVTNQAYLANCFGFRYVPSQDYTLTRIEFYAGDRAGTVAVAVLADDGNGLPTGSVLGSVTYQETLPRRWQGTDFTPPVQVHAGTVYYVQYQPVVNALCSIATGGVIIPHTWSEDQCAVWESPIAPFFEWMARFYSDDVTPARASTWGSVKLIYR